MEHDLIVIGAGPGGYIAAIRAAQLGLNVACIEKEGPLGGTCLRVGCIPSKALLESSELFREAGESFGRHGISVGDIKLDLQAMLKRKDDVVSTLTRGVAALFKKAGVTRYLGRGKLVGPGKVSVESRTESGEPQTTLLQAPHIIIATGSVSSILPGVELDGNRIGTSTDALNYSEVPGHLVVIGAGAIGLELGSVWSRLGAKVTVLEYLNRILPGMDKETAADTQRILSRQGLEFKLGARVKSAKADKKGCVVECEGSDPIHCDRVLLSVGRTPNTEGLGLESVGITTDNRGRIPVDENFATVTPGIYAIGDVIPGAMLAHKAEEEGVACVEKIVTGHGEVNYDAIPSVVYTNPEVASVGKTQEQLEEAGIPFKKGVFPMIANGRAKCMGQTEGKVRILAHAETDRILGVHIVGARAGDLIAEAAVAIEFGASSEDLARTSHAHPTLAESIKEAALAVHGRTLNL